MPELKPEVQLEAPGGRETNHVAAPPLSPPSLHQQAPVSEGKKTEKPVKKKRGWVKGRPRTKFGAASVSPAVTTVPTTKTSSSKTIAPTKLTTTKTASSTKTMPATKVAAKAASPPPPVQEPSHTVTTAPKTDDKDVDAPKEERKVSL